MSDPKSIFIRKITIDLMKGITDKTYIYPKERTQFELILSNKSSVMSKNPYNIGQTDKYDCNKR